jgi:hypothetical protein
MISEKVLPFASSRDDYESDGGCLFWCIDDRYSKLREELIRSRGFKNIDIIQTAGGAKAFVGEGPASDRMFLLGQAKLSLRLHKAKRVILTLHIDCGGYGGSKAFRNDHDAEFRHHEEALVNAYRFLADELPGIEIELYIADFDGLSRVTA